MMSIDNMAQAIKQDNADGQEILNLWQLVLSLDEWYFACLYPQDGAEAVPFIGVVDENKPCFFIFTDKLKAQKFSKQDSRFSNEDGGCVVLNIPVLQALNIVFEAETRGAYAVLMNVSEADSGADFNIPINILRQLVVMFISEGKLPNLQPK